MGKTCCIVLGHGFDDIEAITVINLLRRADIRIDIYGVGEKTIGSFTKVTYQTEFVFHHSADISECKYDGLLLPGGPGVKELLNNSELITLIQNFHAANKLIYAICGAPLLLEAAGVLRGKQYTCLPSVASMITSGNRVEKNVVWDTNIITSKALGTSFDGALTVIQALASEEKCQEIKKDYYIHSERLTNQG